MSSVLETQGQEEPDGEETGSEIKEVGSLTGVACEGHGRTEERQYECDMDAVIQMIGKENEYREIVVRMSGGNSTELERTLREILAAAREFSGWDRR